MWLDIYTHTKKTSIGPTFLLSTYTFRLWRVLTIPREWSMIESLRLATWKNFRNRDVIPNKACSNATPFRVIYSSWVSQRHIRTYIHGSNSNVPPRLTWTALPSIKTHTNYATTAGNNTISRGGLRILNPDYYLYILCLCDRIEIRLLF